MFCALALHLGQGLQCHCHFIRHLDGAVGSADDCPAIGTVLGENMSEQSLGTHVQRGEGFVQQPERPLTHEPTRHGSAALLSGRQRIAWRKGFNEHSPRFQRVQSGVIIDLVSFQRSKPGKILKGRQQSIQTQSMPLVEKRFCLVFASVL